MEIKELLFIENLEQNKNLAFTYSQFQQLLSELRKRELTADVIEYINSEIDQINAITISDKAIRKQIIKSQAGILRLIEQKQKLVVKKYYLKQWAVLGVGLWGLPLSYFMIEMFGHVVFLALGILMGIALGMLSGFILDKKALKEGRQIDMPIELRFKNFKYFMGFEV